MFCFLIVLLAVLAGLGVRKLLARTGLSRTAQVLIAGAAGAAAAILLYHAALYLSILLFLAHEPISW